MMEDLGLELDEDNGVDFKKMPRHLLSGSARPKTARPGGL